MKEIQNLTIWNNGQFTANRFNLKLISDNLMDTAVFVYELYNYDSTPVDPMKGESQYTLLLTNNLTIDGLDYTNWTGDSLQAYQICATKLNIVLL